MAEKYYLQVTEEHWAKAILPKPVSALTVALVTTHSGTITRNHEIPKPSVLIGGDGTRG